MTKPTAEERFWAKVNKTPTCWLWTATKIARGYGWFWNGKRGTYAHRWAYELLVGPIPQGHEIDHLCRNSACVNPAHLEPVSHRENVLRGEGPSAIQARTAQCRHGHPFTEANTYVRRNGKRECRTCKQAAERAAYRRRTTRLRDALPF